MIEKNLENGAYVGVKSRDGEYQVFSPYKDPNGYYRSSGWMNSIERTKQFIGWGCGCKGNLDELAKEENWQVVEIFYGQQPKFKEGDRVRVLDSGRVGKVSEQGRNITQIEDTDGFFLAYENTNLAHAEEEPKVEEMTLEEVCKELGRDIKIKK